MSAAVEVLRTLEEGAWSRAIARSMHLPHAAVPGLDPAFRAARLLGDAQRALAAGGKALGLFDESGSAIGFALLEPLPHETRHFARRCARLRFADAWSSEPRSREQDLRSLLAGVVERSDREAFDVLWLQWRAIDYALQHAASAAGFRCADALVDWVGRAEALHLPEGDALEIEHGARPELAERCGALARDGMRFNRFRAEPRFEATAIDALYAELGERCARGEIGAHFLCARTAGGEPIGFAALEWAVRRSEGAPCEIGAFRFLVKCGSAPPGTGAALLEAGCRYLIAQGAGLLLAQTVVQNAGMFRGALRIGFRVEDALYDGFRWRPS